MEGVYIYVVRMTGSAHKLSEGVEEALENYMMDPRLPRAPEGESFFCVSVLSVSHLCELLQRKRAEGYSSVMLRMWK
jgi:hypothetical protein